MRNEEGVVGWVDDPATPGLPDRLVTSYMQAMAEYLEVRREAERLFHLGESFAALRLYRRLLDVHPVDYQVRLHVGDALARLGQRARARQVHAALTVQHLKAGRTLPALVAAKALDEVDPTATDILGKMAAMYGAGSGRTQPEAAPTEIPPPPDAELSWGATDVPPAEILAAATVAASSLQGRVERVGPLPRLPLFSDLDADDMLLVLRAMRRVRFAQGEGILQEGQPGVSFFLVAHGRVSVTRQEGEQQLQLAELTQGALLGELALIHQGPRTATATALDEVDALEVPQAALREVASCRPAVAQALDQFSRQRLMRGVIARSPLLRPFYPDRLERLMELFVPRSFAPGDALLREGDSGQGLFVLLSGEAEVYRWDGRRQIRLARLGPAEVIGEMSLIDGRPVSATVLARGTTSALFLPKLQFDRLRASHPELLQGLQTLAETRKFDNLLLLADDNQTMPGGVKSEVFL